MPATTTLIVTSQQIPLTDLRPHPRNYNRHSATQVERIAASLSKFGQTRSIVVWRSTILAGHGVVEAARSLGWTSIRADVLPDDYPEHLALAYLVADNELARHSDPDQAQLAALLDEARAQDAGLLAAMGYDEAEFAALLKEVGRGVEPPADVAPQLDRAEELRVKWGVESGQLWELGAHRLICGDCTDAAVVQRVMGGERAQLVVTDPPYGVSYEGGRNPLSNIPRSKLSGDSSGQLYGLCMTATIPYCDDAAAWYLWFAGTVGKPVYDAVSSAGYTVRAMIVWNKLDAHYGNFMAQYMQKHEPCLYCVKRSPIWNGPTNEVTVWDVKQPTKNEYHPTEKPVELIRRAIGNSSDDGAIVADWFLGSGTTLIACEQLARRCRAIEIAPAYVAVALQRWSDVTGKTPVLVESAP